MSDLERVELALRRALALNGHGNSIGVLMTLADELARMSKPREQTEEKENEFAPWGP